MRTTMIHPHTKHVYEIEEWAASARDLLHDCVASTRAEEIERLREMVLLLRAAPMSLSGYARVPQAEAIEALLDCGAAFSAAMSIIDEEANFILSRGRNGVCLVSMVQPGETQELTAEARTVSLALLAALLTVLIVGAERARDGIIYAPRSFAAGRRMH